MNKRPLKIGYLMQADSVQMNKNSGPQLHVKAVVEGFKRRGHQVRMVAIQKGRIQWSDDLVKWHPADFSYSESKPFRMVERILRGIQTRLHLPFLRLFDSYRFSDACANALAGYDILFERDGMISYGGLITARRLGIPIVLEVNGDLVEEYAQLGIQLSKVQWGAINLISRLIFKHASQIVAVGETIKQRLVRRWHLEPSHVTVVTNGADIDIFRDDSNVPANVRSRYSIGDGAVIMFIGSFKPWHGVDLLVDSFASLRAPRATLVLVGDGPLRSDMQSKADSLCLENRIVFTGKVEHGEVASLLSIADVAVIYHRASAAEIVETPLKLFEYMAAGKAIVAPAVPNMERILTNRVTGLLVPPDNPEALAGALVELLEDEPLRSKIGQAAKEEAIEKHSWDRAVSELEAILYDLLDEQKA